MSTKNESNKKAGPRMQQTRFDPSWVGSTGFMTEALGIVKGKNDPWLMGLQVLDGNRPKVRGSSRYMHTMEMIEQCCTAQAMDDRPMRFRIRDRSVLQEVKGMADNHATGRRFNYKGVATITQNNISVKIAGDNWEEIPIAGAYGIIEEWVPMCNSNMPASYAPIWVQTTTLLQVHTDFAPKYNEGVHRCIHQLLGEMLRNVSISHAIANRSNEQALKTQATIDARSAMQRAFSLSERALSAYGKYIRRSFYHSMDDHAQSEAVWIYKHVVSNARKALTANCDEAVRLYEEALRGYIAHCQQCGHAPPNRVDDLYITDRGRSVSSLADKTTVAA